MFLSGIRQRWKSKNKRKESWLQSQTFDLQKCVCQRGGQFTLLSLSPLISQHCHKLVASYYRHLFSHSSGQYKSKIKVPAAPVPLGILRGASAPCLFLASGGCQGVILGIPWLADALFQSLHLFHHMPFPPVCFLCVSCFSFLGQQLLYLRPTLIHCNLHPSQDSPEKQISRLYINIERFIIRNWLMGLWTLTSSKICSWQAEDVEPFAIVLVQRPAGYRSRKSQFQFKSEAGKRKKGCQRYRAVRQKEFPLIQGRVSLFVLFRPSIDWMRSTHIKKGNLFYFAHLNIRFIQKYPHRNTQNNV